MICRPSALVALFILAGTALGAAPEQAGTEANRVYQEALAKLQSGDLEAAVAGFLKAGELAPNWGAPNARLGVIYQLQGKEPEAREQYALAQTASFAGARVAPDEETLARRKLVISSEAYLVFLVNSARLQQGLKPLVPDPTLALVARRHSEEMRDLGYFDHDSPTPGMTNCQDRFRAVFGYKPRCIAENVSRRWGTLYSLREEKILGSHQDLMNSPGHRRNILQESCEWLGVGLAANSNGDYWFTEVFVQTGR